MLLLRSIYSSPSLRRIRMVPSIRTARYPQSSVRLQQPPKVAGGRWKSSSTPLEKLVPIRPWGTTMVESNGDYREEMWIEDHVGGPLYQYQKKLPSLPVPEVPATIERLVPTVLPLAMNAAEQQAFSQAVQKFPSQAAALQVRLQQRAADIGTTSSWLQQWWNTWCYLQVRDPVVINVSYFFHFANDPTAQTMLQRGASLLTAVAQFRHAVATGQHPAEVIGKGDKAKPLCSVAYKYMFNACRIPQLQQDAYRIYDPALHHHVIVAVRGQFFKVPLVDAETSQPYGIPALEAALQDCIDQANNNTRGAVPLGWCTSSNRDTWAKARTRLLEAGGLAMEEALQELESGAVLLCLDMDDTVVSRSEIAALLLHGSGKGNRWFDKSVQLIVSVNGKAGLLGEHSMMDGMPVVQLADHITKTTYAACLDRAVGSQRLPVTPVFSAALSDTIRTTAEPLIEQAKNDFNELVGNNSLHVQSFQGYGSTFMKQSGYSPDAYVQMAMQLATYRLWGEQAGTYEATQVRPFLHGRTETTRSVSIESAALVQKFGFRPANDEVDPVIRKEKLHLFQKAVKAHVNYIGNAAQAQGVDRHLLGLSMLVQEGEPTPELYGDPVFQRAKRWRVSTSHLTHPKFDGWGYGQVVPDGVGLAYSIHPRHCIFNITALKHTGWTEKLSQLLEEALLELRTLIEMDSAVSSTNTITSKL